MRLFLVWDSEGVSKKTDTVIEDLFEACDCDSEEPRKSKRKSVKRKRELHSVSEEENDKDDKDDDDDDGSEESATSSPQKADKSKHFQSRGNPQHALPLPSSPLESVIIDNQNQSMKILVPLAILSQALRLRLQVYWVGSWFLC